MQLLVQRSLDLRLGEAIRSRMWSALRSKNTTLPPEK
jgi:hypothetical protein